MNQILEDAREIQSIWWEPDGSYSVGVLGTTKIEVYPEAGQFCVTPWFAIWKGSMVVVRVNAASLAGISYKEPE